MTTADTRRPRRRPAGSPVGHPVDRPAGHGPGTSGWAGRTLVAVVVAVFVLFFVIPIVWLLLASTKSPHDLITTGPFTAGTFSDPASARRASSGPR